MQSIKPFLVIMISILSLVACKKNDLPPNYNNEVEILENEALSAVVTTEQITTSIKGIIRDENGEPLEGVRVKVGNKTAITYLNGEFMFLDINVNKDFALVKASREGYFDGFRTFTPTVGRLNTIRIQLIKQETPQEFQSTTGGTLTFDNNIVLDFPENSVVTELGELYQGKVYIYSHYFSPMAENLGTKMPGALIGLSTAGTFDALVSYGMLNVELQTSSGEALEIANGKNVEIRMPASENAPMNIPLWHFNEQYGLWVESEAATKEGEQYVGMVNHFSTWNLDVKEDGYEVALKLMNESGDVIGNQQVDIYSEENAFLATVYSDDKGEFKLIRAPEKLNFHIVFPCDEKTYQLVDIRSGSVTLVIENTNPALRFYTLDGRMSDCENGMEIFYTNAPIEIIASNKNTGERLSFSGITDEQGYYKITKPLCNIDEGTEYDFQSIILITVDEELLYKNILGTIHFTNANQAIDLSYCAVDEEFIPGDYPVNFEDPLVEEGIRRLINKNEGILTYGDIKYLEVIDIYEDFFNLYYLSGIEYCSNARVLRFSARFGVLFDDLSPLSKLSKLEEINTEGVFDKVSPLSGLINLKKINLLSSRYIEDVASLNSLINLEELDIGRAKWDIFDFSKLEYLERLDMEFDTIPNLSFIIEIPNLKSLTLRAPNEFNLEGLSSMQNLKVLDLGYNSIVELAELSTMTNLEHLELQFNEIVDLSAVSNLKNLKTLDLARNKITDISVLCNLGASSNVKIDLRWNPLTQKDLDGLQSCLPDAEIIF